MEQQLKSCKICGAPSKGFMYGALACDACKVFFKRNVERGLDLLKCSRDRHCEINIHTRYACNYCRLAKCLASGMQKELLRGPHSKAHKIHGKRKTIAGELISKEISQIRPLNLLQIDQSTLTNEQWSLLSNLSHCYDEHAGLFLGEQYMSQQNHLPHRLRFKIASILELFQVVTDAARSLYANNRDFLTLSPDDRSILLHGTLTHTASLSGNFILYQIQILNHPSFYEAVRMMGPEDLVSTAKLLSQLLNFDMIVMKLFLAILSFSTFRYSVYPDISSVNLSNVQDILRIQDRYVELTWRYLLYKYDHKQAVKCFCQLLRCIFIVNASVVIAQNARWFTEIIDSVTEKAEQVLFFND